VGEGKRERERERERGRELTSGSKFGDHRLQNLGHHGERDRGGGEEVAVRENQMRGARGPERTGLGRAGLGRTAGQNTAARTTTDRNPIHEMKTEMTLGKHVIKDDIRQKKYDSA
jgi:hypothetical protein